MVKKPQNLSMPSAAGLGWAFAIAYKLLFEKAHLSPSQVVLIHCIFDGIDIAIIEVCLCFEGEVFHFSLTFWQICKAIGASIIVLVQPEKVALLKEKHNVPVFDGRSPDIGPTVRAMSRNKGISIFSFPFLVYLRNLL